MRRLARHMSSRLLPIVAACVINALPASAQDIARASFGDPTTRYDHGVLGDAVEWGSLTLGLADGTRRRIILPQVLVFEDTSPRIADLDGDGQPEVIVVESHQSKGARLAVYGASGVSHRRPLSGGKTAGLPRLVLRTSPAMGGSRSRSSSPRICPVRCSCLLTITAASPSLLRQRGSPTTASVIRTSRGVSAHAAHTPN